LAYTAWIEFVYDGNTYRLERDIAIDTVDTSTAATVTFTELQERLARFLFGHRSTTGLSTDEVDDIAACIKDGLQSVYLAHRWSFMRPVYPITTAVDEETYDLPAGYDAIEGDLTYPADSAGFYPPIKIIKESEIRRLRTISDESGRPTKAAIITAAFNATTGSKRQIVFYPTPDAIYVLSAIMRLRPTMIDANNPYPLGGEVLAPVIVEACLAAAERTFRDGGEVHEAKYKELLELAIVVDKDAASPDSLGTDCNAGIECGEVSIGGINVYFDNVLM